MQVQRLSPAQGPLEAGFSPLLHQSKTGLQVPPGGSGGREIMAALPRARSKGARSGGQKSRSTSGHSSLVPRAPLTTSVLQGTPATMVATTKFVLCHWKGRWWPAKVLSRPGTSAKSKRKTEPCLEVQILAVDEKVKVKSADTKALTQPEIEALASSSSAGAGAEVQAPAEEEAGYRRALSLALEMLKEETVLGPGTALGEPGALAVSPKTPEQEPAGPRPRKKYRRRHKGYPWKSSEKKRRPRSQLVLPEAEDDLQGEKAQVQALTVPQRDSKGGRKGKHGSKKLGKSEAVSSSTPLSVGPSASGEGAGATGDHQAPSWQQDSIPRAPRVLKKGADNMCPETLDASHGSSIFLDDVEDPGEGTSWQGGDGTTASCEGPNPSWRRSLRIAGRKRKIQGPDEKKGPGLQPPDTSKAPKATVTTSKRPGGMQHKEQASTKLAVARKPGAIRQGMIVWFKFHDYPFWPALVKSVDKTEQRARVLLMEPNMRQECSGIRVPLHRLKPLECEEKEKLLRRASKAFQRGINWCLALIAHYREGIRNATFLGSFLDYYAADASYPIRKIIRESDLEIPFPKLNYADLEDSEEDEGAASGPRKSLRKKLLPDRMKAVHDRANQKLVDFIVKTKGADCHLLDIVQGRKQSTWLTSFLNTSKYMLCIETYLEDDDQLDDVVKHLQEIYKQTDRALLALIKEDKVRFLLEVLLPEAIICSIAALDGLDYKRAEEKYLRGPPVRYREKDLFDKNILRERRKRHPVSSRPGRPGAFSSP